MDYEFEKKLLIAAARSAGFGVVLLGVALTAHWYFSRPEPPKLWNVSAIVAQASPRFRVSGDGKKIQFTYDIENTTRMDFHIESTTRITIMAKMEDGVFSEPVPSGTMSVDLPVFVPAKRKGSLVVSALFSEIPERKPSESDIEYHEKVRNMLEKDIGEIAGFALFDEANRYEIDLPRWSAKPHH
jgi:hypothetical protein